MEVDKLIREFSRDLLNLESVVGWLLLRFCSVQIKTDGLIKLGISKCINCIIVSLWTCACVFLAVGLSASSSWCRSRSGGRTEHVQRHSGGSGGFVVPRGAAEIQDGGWRGRCVCWWGYDSEPLDQNIRNSRNCQRNWRRRRRVDLPCTIITDT